MGDLPPTQQRLPHAGSRGERPALPGLQRRPEVPPQGAGSPAWPVEGGHRTGVSRTGSHADAGQDLEGWWTSLGAVPQGEWQPGPALPPVPSPVPRTAAPRTAAPAGDAARAAERAVERARDADWWSLASPQSWHPGLPTWRVPSRTTPGQFYTVARIREWGDDWWRSLDCNCEAIRSGRYAVCWHKAAVWLRHQALRHRK